MRRFAVNYPADDSFRLIVETIPGLVALMTAKGEVEYVNRQILNYFGRTLEELKQWGTTDAVHPDDLPCVMAAWRSSLEAGTAYEIEHRLRPGGRGVSLVPIARTPASQR